MDLLNLDPNNEEDTILDSTHMRDLSYNIIQSQMALTNIQMENKMSSKRLSFSNQCILTLDLNSILVV